MGIAGNIHTLKTVPQQKICNIDRSIEVLFHSERVALSIKEEWARSEPSMSTYMFHDSQSAGEILCTSKVLLFCHVHESQASAADSGPSQAAFSLAAKLT